MPAWMRPRPVALPQALVDAVESRPLAEILYRRGFTTPEGALAFLSGGLDVNAPGLPDLDEGVHYVVSAILTRRRICVYGDYDTDGVTATTLLVDLLRRLGADVTYYIPNRFHDGYGMNSRAVEALASEGTVLLLTCDCGIRNLGEVALARKLGMTVVVTDHHELGPALPDAEAVINPKRLPEGDPCRMLPGVGTAYLLARQVLRALDRNPDEADRWLDLVAVGIIADVVPLSGANRELARRGLARLNTSPTPGLLALKEVSGGEGPLTEEDVAFQLVPRLNAAGRLADAALGVRLLLAEEYSQARDLALQLDQLNQERKRLTTTVVEAATAEVPEGAGVILLYRPDWHEGVLGIAAGKLAEQHGVPALLMTRKHGSNIVVGSARAPEGYVLHEALNACGEHLLKHGGHAGAAGFSLLEENVAAFRAAMLEEMRRRVRTPLAAPPRPADMLLPLGEINRGLYDHLRRAAPYGEANPEPVFYAPDVKLLSSRPIGPGERHLRLVVRDDEQSFVAVWWGAGALQLQPQTADLFYRLGLHRWNGEEVLQLVVEHLGPPAAEEEAPLVPVSAPVWSLPDLVDRRGQPLESLLSEFPEALYFAEGPTTEEPATDRYGLRPAEDLVLLTPLASPRLLDEAVARTGARRLILAWPTKARPEEERFLPTLLRVLGQGLAHSPYASVPRLAVRMGELEIGVRLGVAALAASSLVAVDEETGDQLRLRRRTDGHGVQESDALTQLRRILSESRAFRRFLRQAPTEAIQKVIYAP